MMSERAPQQHESYGEALQSAEHVRALPTPEQAEALRPGEADPAHKLLEARQEAAEHANRGNPVQRLEAAEKAAAEPQTGPVNRELKAITLHRELKNIRRQLPQGQRQFSRLIHQPAVRAVSETAAKSVSRPSGLLGGGLVAFIGCSGYLYLARHIGFSYNYLVFLLLFAAGFVVGLILELLVWTFTRRHTQA